jgi:hypothetical protein
MNLKINWPIVVGSCGMLMSSPGMGWWCPAVLTKMPIIHWVRSNNIHSKKFGTTNNTGSLENPLCKAEKTSISAPIAVKAFLFGEIDQCLIVTGRKN